MNARSVVIWGVKYGLPGLALRISARRGELVARLLRDPALLHDPYPAYDQFRAGGPLFTDRFITATASYATATEILRSDAFKAGPTPETSPLFVRLLTAALDPMALAPDDPPSLIAIDGEQHTRLRRLVSRAFTARAITSLTARVEELAHELLDEIAARRTGGFDLIGSYAALLPVTVIAEILGVPTGMRRTFLGWADNAALALEPGLSWRDHRRAEAAARSSHAWLDQHIATLRREPGDDLLSRMIQESDRVTDTELRVTALLVLGAGFETTLNLIGNAVSLLLAHPDQLDRLKAEPEGWPGAIEEVLRYDSPVQITLRTARVDTEINGTVIRAGRPVVVALGGANRDPDVFPDPHLFDSTRANAREHLSFSSGSHFCLGAQLARLEATTAMRALFERFPELRLDGQPTRRGTRILRGYEHLPVTPEKRSLNPSYGPTNVTSGAP